MKSEREEKSTSEEVRHGLPAEVLFCRRCVMSNQRPASSPEFKKQTSTDTPQSTFGENQICDACHYAAFKKNIDWEMRRQELEAVCDRFRRADGGYDVLIPGSGGKDSIFVSKLLRDEFDMNPLTVTWAPHAYTDIGRQNMDAWHKLGFDNILFTPDPSVHATLTRLAFDNLLNPFQPFIIGQKLLAPRIALQLGIEFIMYGENPAEAHNSITENETPTMNKSHYSAPPKQPIYLGGKDEAYLRNELGLDRNKLQPYIPLDSENSAVQELEVHYMSYYVNWSPQGNYFFATEVSDFAPNPAGRSEGTYTKFSSLDDKVDGQHYFTMFVKFGQGRAMNDACRDIRDGHISRDEGVALVRRFDGEFPGEHFQFFLDYISLSEHDYWRRVDGFRSPHLWSLKNNQWQLRHECR